jgi:hypothetical protein
MMPTLLLSPRYTDDAQALWRAAGRLGWRVERLHGWRVPEDLLTVPEPVLYVEVLTAHTIAEQFHVRLLEPPDDWLPRLPEQYRKRLIRMMTLADARQLEEPAFVKPPNDKSFAAGVYHGRELPDQYDPTMRVLVSEVVEWEKEFRCFILHRKLKTFSIYLRDGQLQRENDFASSDEEDAQMTSFMEAILSDPEVILPRTAVLDVGIIKGRGWAVVEQNAAWGSGIYGCDPAAVLEVVRHAAVPIPPGDDHQSLPPLQS